jgi:arabinoxylan arabinofuranohydrolase
MKKIYLFLLFLSFQFIVFGQSHNNLRRTGLLSNPILPGYYADPTFVEDNGTYYIYVTIDPWGNDFLACWESKDMKNWTFHKLNWPTKQLCTSNLSNGNKVWAPSIVKKNGKYYMYVSVGSEVWCGVAEHPLGPWKNMLDGVPLIKSDVTKYYHVIDAEAFLDSDGKSYLYWGSGLGWINGHCFAAQLGDDMCSFKTKPLEVTPKDYFEAPFMLKYKSKYYLMYSEGKTIDATYNVRYAIGNSPFGPFKEAPNSPILKADSARNVFGPGHHTIAHIGGQTYILYHKHKLPYKEGSALRQLCIDSLNFTADGLIKNVSPSDRIINPLKRISKNTTKVKDIKVSSIAGDYCKAENLFDDSFQTIWYPAPSDKSPWVEFKILVKNPSALRIMPEYAWKEYDLKCEISTDNVSWKTIYNNKIEGSPWIIKLPKNNKEYFVRLSSKSKDFALWEIYVNK